ncbi:MAG: TIM barrel protein [Tannerella sp.]|jgi:sialate O-acetylesterase|nr:TIM barrel protein [Tannerella sp.]
MKKYVLSTWIALLCFAGFPANAEDKPNSRYGGVQTGAITYSFREMPDQSLNAVLDYIVQSGLSSVELMGDVVERYAGIPADNQREWRINASMDKFGEVKRMFDAKGVKIHLLNTYSSNWSDEEIDYIFNVCRTLGAKGISTELTEETAKRLAPFADKHKLYVVLHNHYQPGEPDFSFEKILAHGKRLMLNLDVGHYFGITGKNPCDVIKRLHNRIASLHLKDKTGALATPPNTNMPWGQGQTPLKEILLLLQKEKWFHINCDIELEYGVPQDSNPVREVAKCAAYCRSVLASVKLPAYLTDNMMVQRDKPVKLYGWAAKGETVTVSLNGQKAAGKADKDGLWQIVLNPLPVGGPYEMSIQGKDDIIRIGNILSGDIWVCSGQSNMEWSLRGINHAEKEIADANYPKIRLLTVYKQISGVSEKDARMSGWSECSPSTAADFSAVGYLFGRNLHKELDVPVGLINTSWGGTIIETWMSLDAIKAFPQYGEQVKEELAPNFAGMTKSIETNEDVSNDPGLKEAWYKQGKTGSEWQKIDVPSLWDGFNNSRVGWYHTQFSLTEEQAQSPVEIFLGFIDDNDETYLNGQKIGATDGSDKNRLYKVNKGLRSGINDLYVRVIDLGGAAGFSSAPECRTSHGMIPLAGKWDFRKSITIISHPNAYPSLLYNAMIAPLIRYPVKGAIWYQGESNAWAGQRYEKLFPAMINDWRAAWGQNDLPFYFVQLANFGAPAEQPAESDWAELREAQHKSLNLPNTGEAVIIDIGEANDIHPRNKQDVAYRLALNALAKTYGKPVEYSGPKYRDMKVEGNSVALSFDNIAQGLYAKNRYGYLCGFTIAGADRKFYWANAFIRGDKVYVSSERVISPVAVRYAWSNNPDDANLYNSAGLPASPFRTDDWKGITSE